VEDGAGPDIEEAPPKGLEDENDGPEEALVAVPKGDGVAAANAWPPTEKTFDFVLEWPPVLPPTVTPPLAPLYNSASALEGKFFLKLSSPSPTVFFRRVADGAPIGPSSRR